MSNQTTDYTYDGDGNVLSMTAVMPTGENSQTTDYVYGVGTTIGTDLFSNDLIATVEYPDPTTGDATSSAANDVSYTYDNLGETLTKTDQNGTTHTYTYDPLGRLTLDSVTTLGAGVDGSVLALGYSYNALGLPYQQTSYSDSAGTTVVNQDQDVYNGLQQLTGEYQAVDGAVDTETTVETQYAYSAPGSGSNLTEMIYPNGRILHYGYNDNALDTAIGRVDYLADDNGSGGVGAHDVDYAYLGLSQVVGQAQGNGITMTTTIDPFGRISEIKYVNTSTSTATDDFQYGYDADGNVLYKDNLVNSSFSELYHANSSAAGDDASAYDPLNRLTGFQVGTLTASGNNGSTLDTVTDENLNTTLPINSQSFALDAVGNQTAVTTDGTTADRTANSQNELTGVGAFTLTYDNDGNTTLDQNGNVMTYDAWNRMVSDNNVTTNQAMIYSYDANGRQITEQNTVLMSDGPILIVNNGSAQRSMIDSLTLVFDHPVTVSSGAVTLSGVTNGDITISVTNPSGDGKTYLITFSGDEIASGSLPDDVYTLSVSASGVTNVSNGEATLSSDATYVFARLVGDANGDGTIDTADVTALEATYGNLTNPAMDFYGDGTVGFDDLSLMAQTSGDSVTFTPGSGRIMVAPWTTASTAGDISSWTAGPVTDVYFDTLGQALEERQGSIVTAQYVWNIDYQNDLLLRDDNSVGGSLGKSDSGLGQRLYSQHDANFNVTALVDNSGNVVERFVYTPYGVQTVLTASWVAATDTYGVLYGFQGGRMDPATGLIHFGTPGRDYDPATGAWMEQDPAGYVNGVDVYQFVLGSPARYEDPTGTQAWYQGWGTTVSYLFGCGSASECAQVRGALAQGLIDNGALRAVYTGDPNATDEEYAAAVSGAGAWENVNSPLRGFYAYGQYPAMANDSGFGAALGFESQWTMDDGWTVGAGAYGVYQPDGGGSWAGAAWSAWYNQDDGASGSGISPIWGNGKPGATNFDGAEFGYADDKLYIGLGAKYGGAGAIVDVKMIPNLFNPNANDAAVNALLQQCSGQSSPSRQSTGTGVYNK